jgi:hypothetical protein
LPEEFAEMPATRSPAKLQAIDFVKSTNEENEEYVFSVNGNEEAARRFVHRMRVELSRMRGYVKRRGRAIKHFKMIIVGFETNPDNAKQTIVTLRRTVSNDNVDADVDAILDNGLAGGQLIG